MAGKDIAEKLLEECNDVFADIVNVLYFKEELIKAENLEEAPTEFHYWVQDKSKCRELRRDVAKVLKIDGIPKAIICIENQTCIDPTMPFRIQEYDGATHLMQLKNGEKKTYSNYYNCFVFRKSQMVQTYNCKKGSYSRI